ncbi:hypothetical protein WA577_001929 [Blastocystis sp. JDR]
MVYDADDVIVDMLDIAATFLCVGGRLTYLLPTFGAHGKEEVPRHPCFELVANSEDKLTQLISRRLVTMKKVRAYEAERREEYKEVTRRSLKEFILSYNDLMEMTVEANRSEKKTRPQRRERQRENAKKWEKAVK